MEDGNDCDAVGAGCVGRRVVPSQAGLAKGSAEAMAVVESSWIPRGVSEMRCLRALLWWALQFVANLFLSFVHSLVSVD